MKNEVVELLEDVLEQARAGKVQGVAMITLEPDNEVGQAIVGEVKNDKFKMLGAIEVLKRDLLDGVESLKEHYPEEFKEMVAG